MLLLRLSEPNFYLLDEPTNHLDIEGQDMLESELIEHGAACLLVSHDRAFVQRRGDTGLGNYGQEAGRGRRPGANLCAIAGRVTSQSVTPAKAGAH